MGGIFGATARDNVVPYVTQGLADLEDWDCDSAGLAVLADHQIQRRRAIGRVTFLETLLADEPTESTIALGHVRSATHGPPSRQNAHPLASSRVAVVHNGVIENHAELRAELEREGVQFRSETDSEVVVWLLDRELAAGVDPVSALHGLFPRLKGSFSIAVLCPQHADRLYATSRGCYLAVSRSDDAAFLASSATALGRVSDELVTLEDGQVVELCPGEVRFVGGDLEEVVPRWRRVQRAETKRESGRVIADTARQEILALPAIVRQVLRELGRDLAAGELESWCGPLGRAERILAVAGGASFHAAQIGRTWLEQVASLPAELELSSEVRTRDPVLTEGTVALVVARPEEESDAVEALHHLKLRGIPTVALAHAPSDSLLREAEAVIDFPAAPHAGEASTIASITQLCALGVASVAVRQQLRGGAADDGVTTSFLGLPQAMASALEAEGQCVAVGRRIAEAGHGFFIGRGISRPIAGLSALVLENLADMHAVGIAGGELKHRPMPLLELGAPVLLFAPHDDTFDRTVADAREIAMRGGDPILVGDAHTAELAHHEGWTCISAGRLDPLWSPPVLAVLAHLVVYHAARARGPIAGRPETPPALRPTPVSDAEIA